MDWTHITGQLSNVEPIAWLTVLFAIHFGERRSRAQQTQPVPTRTFDELPPDYRALRVYVTLRFLEAMVYPIFTGRMLSSRLSPQHLAIIGESSFWVLYFLSSICTLFILAALLRRSLQPLPGLSSAALIVFRWAAILAVAIAATAHLPVFGVENLQLLLNEVTVSFVLCICAFELSLLTILVKQMRRLGMCLRSRPIGLAAGLSVLGVMDLCNSATINLGHDVQNAVAALNETSNFFAAALWAFYILRPEPKRLPHALSPASRLMKWNEIALKLGVSGKQAEQVPFISGVESTVDAILERFKGRVG